MCNGTRNKPCCMDCEETEERDLDDFDKEQLNRNVDYVLWLARLQEDEGE